MSTSELFEAWAGAKGMNLQTYEHYGYINNRTRDAWDVWQACAGTKQSVNVNVNVNVDSLAQEIRRVDGDNSLGAAALAEALMPFIVSCGNQSNLYAASDDMFEACLLARGYLLNRGASESDPLLLGAINEAIAKAEEYR